MTTPPRHPSIARFALDWEICRACAGGESEVKRQAARFLPPTTGMRLDGYPNANSQGTHAYLAYLARAVFPSVFAEALAVALGVMHREPAVIELPAKLEALRENATADGLNLLGLLRMINAEQLITGRLGLHVDPVQGASVTDPPRIVLYGGERVINWDTNIVVLDESGPVRDETSDSWHDVQAHRRLSLQDGLYVSQEFRADEFTRTLEPSIGGRRPDFIPFTFVNATSLHPAPEEPPLVGLARLAMAIYRGEADYRQALFMQAQDTLVVIGGNPADGAQRVGAGSAIHLPRGGDAKFIGIDSGGLPEMRQALQNDYMRAARLGLGLLDTSTRERESGEALKTRVASATASLTSVTQTGAKALENALRQTARWMGANEDQVSVQPNTDFSEDAFDPKDLTELMNSRSMGAPISLETIHNWLREKDFAWLDFQDELKQINAEHDGDVMPEDAPLDAEDEDA